MAKFTLRGKKVGDQELDADKVFSKDVEFSHEHHHNFKLWLAGHAFGAVGAVWATNEGEALDEMADCGLLDAFLANDDETAADTEGDKLDYLGNHGTAYNLQTDFWLDEVCLVPSHDWKVMLAFAEARGATHEHLGKL